MVPSCQGGLMIRILVVQIFLSALFLIPNISYGIFRKDIPAGPCPYKKYEINIIDANELNHLGDELMIKQRYCEAIAYYTRAKIETLTPEPRAYAWYRIVEASFYQRDYERLFRETDNYLKEKPNSLYSDRVYYLGIKGYFEQVELTRGESSESIQRLLGLYDAQGDTENTQFTLPTYSFKDFLKRFPESRYAHDINQMWKDLRVLMVDKVLAEARNLVLRREYLPAINKLKMIVNQGPIVEQFAEALFELIKITEWFGYALITEGRLSDWKLAKWLMVSEAEITPDLRKQISKKLLSQAAQMKTMMREKLPDNSWTQRL